MSTTSSSPRRMFVSIGAAFLPAIVLSACAVGPDYKGPPNAAPIAATSPLFHRASLAAVSSAPPVERWWETLGDATLTRLVDAALANSPTIKQATARLRSARAAAGQQVTRLLPSGGAYGTVVGAHLPVGGLAGLGGAGAASGSSSVETTLYSPGFDAIWELDIFGGTRRGIEGARAQAEAQEAALADSQVQLAAEVAQAYVNLRGAQQQVALLRRSVEIEQQLLDVTRRRRALGNTSDVDIYRFETQLNQTLAQIPTNQAQLDASLDQIAVLVGLEPGQLDAILTAPAPLPLLPADVPVGDPAALLRRRPDIRQAERQLAASNATIGQNVAQYFPSVSLFGSIGFSGTDTGRLFTSKSLTYLGGPTLSWNILNFPRIAAQVRGAEADRDAAVAQYKHTVLAALQDAETSLSRYGHQRENVVRLAAAQSSATHAADLTRVRQQGGTASLIDVLDTERQRMQTTQSLVQGQADLIVGYISLQKSLGLGWGAPSQTSTL